MRKKEIFLLVFKMFSNIFWHHYAINHARHISLYKMYDTIRKIDVNSGESLYFLIEITCSFDALSRVNLFETEFFLFLLYNTRRLSLMQTWKCIEVKRIPLILFQSIDFLGSITVDSIALAWYKLRAHFLRANLTSDGNYRVRQ